MHAALIVFLVLVSVLMLLAAVAAAARARFRGRVEAEMRSVLARGASSPSGFVEPGELQHLPPPVRRWLEASGVVGRERIRTVRLAQRGELRTSPDRAWMPTRAEQTFCVDPPMFVWRVDAIMMGIFPVSGRDKYADGHGHMLIKAAALVDVVDAADDKIDQGSLLRFLGEMIWFPSAALSPYLTWEPIDEARAQVTMRDNDLVVSATFTFSAQGRVLGMHAMRYLGAGPAAELTPWVATCSAWQTFQGVEVPSRGQVGWQLASGEFDYYRWEILDLDFNQSEPRRARARPLTNARELFAGK